MIDGGLRAAAPVPSPHEYLMSDTTKEVKIADATADQLREFGNLYLGLAFDRDTPVDVMRTQIGKAVQKSTITVGIDPKPRVRPREAAAQSDGEAVQSDYVVIRIQSQNEPGGEQPVPVGVNGSVMLIPRDQDARIPRSYYEVLKNAVVDRYEPEIVNGLMVGMKSEPRRIPAYPVQLIASAA